MLIRYFSIVIIGMIAVVSADAAVQKKKSQKASKLTAAQLEKILAERFGVDPIKQAAAQKKLMSIPADPAARSAAWKAYAASLEHGRLKEQLNQKSVSTSERTSPYLWRHVGTKPADGWSLVIAMHGGGGAPKAVNDREWNFMFERYYKEHPEAGGYVYLALRAPNDTWNGFYDDAICPLIENLIKQFVLFEEVNPNKVYIMGASHGGYGAFVIGPKIPHRFAAIHAAASAPTDGETMGENLRNVRFTYITGERDTAYGRVERCRKFAGQMEEWRKQYGGYSSRFDCPERVGHIVQDRDQVAEMVKDYRREAYPKMFVWTQSDNVIRRFYWLEALEPVEQGKIEAKVSGNTITIKAEKQTKIAIWLDQSLVDLTKPVTVKVEGGKTKVFKLKSSLETYCLGLEQTADRFLASPARIEISL